MILQQEFDPAVTSLCVAARCLREAARGKNFLSLDLFGPVAALKAFALLRNEVHV